MALARFYRGAVRCGGTALLRCSGRGVEQFRGDVEAGGPQTRSSLRVDRFLTRVGKKTTGEQASSGQARVDAYDYAMERCSRRLTRLMLPGSVSHLAAPWTDHDPVRMDVRSADRYRVTAARRQRGVFGGGGPGGRGGAGPGEVARRLGLR